jgi:hypothetical protein
MYKNVQDTVSSFGEMFMKLSSIVEKNRRAIARKDNNLKGRAAFHIKSYVTSREHFF